MIGISKKMKALYTTKCPWLKVGSKRTELEHKGQESELEINTVIRL